MFPKDVDSFKFLLEDIGLYDHVLSQWLEYLERVSLACCYPDLTGKDFKEISNEELEIMGINSNLKNIPMDEAFVVGVFDVE